MEPIRPRRDEHIRPEEIIRAIQNEPKDEPLKDIPVTPKNYGKFEGGQGRRAFPKGIFWGVGGLIALFVMGLFLSFYAVRDRVSGAIAANLTTIQAGVNDLQNLDPQSAQKEFASLQDGSSTGFGNIVSRLGFLFRQGSNAVASFSSLSGNLTTMSAELATLELNGVGALVRGDGAPVIAELSALRDTVGAINAESDQLSNEASYAGGFASPGGADFYLSLKEDLSSAQDFLNAFVPWIATSTPHHVLVLFDNPSELRPGGGFLGSYADVTLASGTITSVAVHDVADVDLAFKKLIVPPKPLQLELKNFRPADANWFFDFPTSASETISLFEESGLYAASGTTFDAAIALTPKVVRDLLAVTGPITVGSPPVTFTPDNLVVAVQKIVENGQATNATYPKQILRDLSHAIMTALASSTDAERQELTGMMLNWVADKDAMIYFKDPALQNFVDANGASGAVYQLAQGVNGDYLAVVDANIQSGKSNLYVSSTVAYTAVINMDGTISDHILITREHHGNTSPYSWYKTTNQDYLQLFVPLGSTLVNASGGVTRTIKVPANYAAKGYTTDPLVAAIEGTEQSLFGYPGVSWHTDAGKEVFTTWSVVRPGASTQFSLDYSHRLPVPPGEGVQYQFVFEKQAGTNRRYTIEIDAPLGYQFAENGLATFDYDSSEEPMPGRLTITLTLEKIAG